VSDTVGDTLEVQEPLAEAVCVTDPVAELLAVSLAVAEVEEDIDPDTVEDFVTVTLGVTESVALELSDIESVTDTLSVKETDGVRVRVAREGVTDSDAESDIVMEPDTDLDSVTDLEAVTVTVGEADNVAEDVVEIERVAVDVSEMDLLMVDVKEIVRVTDGVHEIDCVQELDWEIVPVSDFDAVDDGVTDAVTEIVAETETVTDIDAVNDLDVEVDGLLEEERESDAVMDLDGVTGDAEMVGVLDSLEAMFWEADGAGVEEMDGTAEGDAVMLGDMVGEVEGQLSVQGSKHVGWHMPPSSHPWNSRTS